jgi:hypothetical protein
MFKLDISNVGTKNLIHKKKPAVILFRGDNDAGSHYFSVFTEVAKAYKGKILFVDVAESG